MVHDSGHVVGSGSVKGASKCEDKDEDADAL